MVIVIARLRLKVKYRPMSDEKSSDDKLLLSSELSSLQSDFESVARSSMQNKLRRFADWTSCYVVTNTIHIKQMDLSDGVYTERKRQKHYKSAIDFIRHTT